MIFKYMPEYIMQTLGKGSQEEQKALMCDLLIKDKPSDYIQNLWRPLEHRAFLDHLIILNKVDFLALVKPYARLGQDIREKSAGDDTVLHLAARHAHSEQMSKVVVPFLSAAIEQRPDLLQSKNNHGVTPLTLAIQHNNIWMVQYLLMQFGLFYDKISSGSTPSTFRHMFENGALAHNKPEIMALLKRYGADLIFLDLKNYLSPLEFKHAVLGGGASGASLHPDIQYWKSFLTELIHARKSSEPVDRLSLMIEFLEHPDAQPIPSASMQLKLLGEITFYLEKMIRDITDAKEAYQRKTCTPIRQGATNYLSIHESRRSHKARNRLAFVTFAMAMLGYVYFCLFADRLHRQQNQSLKRLKKAFPEFMIPDPTNHCGDLPKDVNMGPDDCNETHVPPCEKFDEMYAQCHLDGIEYGFTVTILVLTGIFVIMIMLQDWCAGPDEGVSCYNSIGMKAIRKVVTGVEKCVGPYHLSSILIGKNDQIDTLNELLLLLCSFYQDTKNQDKLNNSRNILSQTPSEIDVERLLETLEYSLTLLANYSLRVEFLREDARINENALQQLSTRLVKSIYPDDVDLERELSSSTGRMLRYPRVGSIDVETQALIPPTGPGLPKAGSAGSQ